MRQKLAKSAKVTAGAPESGPRPRGLPLVRNLSAFTILFSRARARRGQATEIERGMLDRFFDDGPAEEGTHTIFVGMQNGFT